MHQKLIQRAMSILMKPTGEWTAIKNEKWSTQDLYVKYALLLGAIPALAGFIGYALIGISVFGVTIRYPFVNAIVWTVLQYALSMGMVFGIAAIMDALAPTFGAKKDFNTSLKIVVFSWTASWVGGIFMIIPSLSPLAMLTGIYSLVLLYFGMSSIREIPKEKMVGYYVTVLVLAIVLAIVVGVIAGIALPSAGSAVSGATSDIMRNLR